MDVNLLSGNLLPFLTLVTLWTLPWKGWALWLAARRKEKVWFIVLLVVNTLAILEIIYIFAIAKRSDRKENSAAHL
jgi:hypothetical protein